jgi:hypothetical protein
MSKKMFVHRVLPAVCISLALSACQVPPNLGETTAPTITVTLRDKLGNQGWSPNNNKPGMGNNQYILPVSSSTLLIDNLNPNMDILIGISGHDSGGMSTLTGDIAYFGNCTQSLQSVSVTLTNINESATHNAPNTVTDTLPFLYELTSSTLKSAQAQHCPGERDGLGTVILAVGASNQAGHSSVANYYLHITGGVIPM